MKTRIKNLVLASIILAYPMLGFSASALQSAGTGPNSVYIEQVGDTNTITIEQIGGSNKVGGVTDPTPSSTNYALISGSSNIIDLTQTGDNNLGQYKILGSDNSYTSTVTGYDNQTKLTIGNTNNANNGHNAITETINGDTNVSTQTIVGNNNTSSTSITGNNNSVTKAITTSSAINNVTISGNNNTVYSEQSGAAGSAGHELVLSSVGGDYNTYTIQQQGTNDTTVNIQTTGGHNTVTVRTSNTAIVNPLTSVAR